RAATSAVGIASVRVRRRWSMRKPHLLRPFGIYERHSQEDGPYSYQLAAMLSFLIFADNLLGRIEGPGETMWFWLRSGRWELIFVSGVLSVVCQLLFWSGIVLTGNR